MAYGKRCMWAFYYVIIRIIWHDICAHKIHMSKLSFFVCLVFVSFYFCHQLTRCKELNFDVVEFLKTSSMEGRRGRGIDLKTSWVILAMIRKMVNGSQTGSKLCGLSGDQGLLGRNSGTREVEKWDLNQLYSSS